METSVFTFGQIKEAHQKIKSGKDFPAFIRDIKLLGVMRYETFVADGHTDYFGSDRFIVSSPAKYNQLQIDKAGNPEIFLERLQAHQHGKTDYLTFCADCAETGVEKWTVDVTQMTCGYFDRKGAVVLIETIPLLPSTIEHNDNSQA